MWTTLKTPADWVEYQKSTAKGLQILPERVNWGTGPEDYPCMVCTLFPPRPPGTDPKAYSAFVYQTDAEELLLAAGRKFLDRDAPVPANQQQFNRWVTAKLLTIVHYMVETGLCAPKGGVEANKAAFEEKLLESICLVDEYHGEKKDELKKQLSSSQITVLDTLDPPR